MQHTFPITFRLLFGLLIVCMLQAYGLSACYGLGDYNLTEDHLSDKALEASVYLYNIINPYVPPPIDLAEINEKGPDGIFTYKPLKKQLLDILKESLRACIHQEVTETELEKRLLQNINQHRDIVAGFISVHTLDKDKILQHSVCKLQTLSNIYKAAMQVYSKHPVNNLFQSYLAFFDLKGKMGKQQTSTWLCAFACKSIRKISGVRGPAQFDREFCGAWQLQRNRKADISVGCS